MLHMSIYFLLSKTRYLLALVSLFLILISDHDATGQTFHLRVSIDSLHAGIKKSNSDSLKAAYMMSVGRVYVDSSLAYSINLWDSATYWLNKSIHLAKKRGETRLLASGYTHTSRVFLHDSGNILVSIHFMDSAYQCHKILGDTKRMGTSLIALANRYETLGNYPKSLEYFQLGLEKALSGDYFRLQIGTYSGLGNLYSALGNYELSNEYYFKGLAVWQNLAIQRLPFNSYTYTNIAANYISQDNYNQALFYLTKALKILRNSGLTDLSAETDMLLNLSDCKTEIGELDSALYYGKSALQLSQRLSSPVKIAHSHQYLAYIYMAMGNHTIALQNAHKAETISKDINQLAVSSDVNGMLSKLYGNIGDYKKAYDYQVQFKLSSDSLLNESNIKRLTTIENEYIFKLEQDSVNRVYETQLTEQKVEQQAQQMWLYGMIIGIVLLLIIAFLVYYLLTGRIKIKDKLIANERELEQLKSDFFLNVAHELRTPLTLIQGPLEELNNIANLTSGQKRSFQRIKKNSQKLVTMSEEILQISKLESAKLELVKVTFPFKETVHQLYSNFEDQAQAKGISYHFEDLMEEDFWMISDKVKFEQIFEVLISNALKYSREGDQVTFIVNENIEQGTIQLTVRDTGIGIDKKDHASIFKRYYQTKTARGLKLGGVGIGLSLAYGIVRALNGQIEVKSQLNEGSSFVVTLAKIVDDTKTEIPNQFNQPLIDTNESTKSSSPKVIENKAQVLVIDDDLDLLEYIAEILSINYQVITAVNGKQGLSILKSHVDEIKLVVSDVMMPEIDGFELLTCIRSDEVLRTIPVILLTAMDQDKHRVRAMGIGVSDYITKPFEENALLASCEHLLSYHMPSTQHDKLPQKLETEWLRLLDETVRVYLPMGVLDWKHIAKELDLEEDILLARMRQYTGLQPDEYIKESRLQQARMSIESENYYSLIDLSEEIGFSNCEILENEYFERFGVNIKCDKQDLITKN